MEGEERPRKLAKLDHSEMQEDSEPTMTGALDKPDLADAHNKKADDDDVSDNEASPVNGGDDDLQTGEAATCDGNEAEPKLSKRQMKKLQRREKWEEGREDRKVKRKERLAARRERQRAELQEAKLNGKEATLAARKAQESTKQRFARSKLLPITFILDCDFDDLMLDNERISLAQQLTRCYSDNSKNPYRSHLVLSSFNKKLKERYDNVMAKMYKNWKGVRFFDEDHVHAAALAKDWMAGPEGGQLAGMFTDKTDAKPEDGEVIYLSSDSENTLTELKPYSTYIVGGLVDKNRHKGICHKRAVEKGIKTAKLPIGEYIQMASRSVLTTNHVVEIMLRWLELGDWGKAFMEVLPQRKGGVLRNKGDEAKSEAKSEEEQNEAEAKVEEDQQTKEDVTEVIEA